MKHEIKCWPQYFARLADGSKTFEVRRNDRGYQQGDTLLVREWAPPHTYSNGRYTGAELQFTVGFVLSACEAAPLGDLVVLSLLAAPSGPTEEER
jgi:hypothetical protein